MPRLRIDHRDVEVPPGATVLDAARTLGIDVPTLCFLEGCKPSTSCLVCMVKIRGQNKLVPACGTGAVEGMEIDSETEEVHQVRRTALELLLSDHLGDCLAPCHFACPAHMDIPLMLRQIAQEDLAEAIVTVKDSIALPAILGRICPKPCEKGCRRAAADGAVAVCQLKRFVADADLASPEPYLPECRPASGKRVAVVGAGPTGLSATYYLLRLGHAVSLFDDQPQPGGRLWRETTAENLPRDVLEAETRLVLRLGADYRPNTKVGQGPSLDDLRREFDAVLLACGATDKPKAQQFGLKAAAHGLAVDRETFRTELPGVFAAGSAIRAKGLVVRSVGDGHEAAWSIHQHLSGLPVSGAVKPFSSRIGRLEEEEVRELVVIAGQAPRNEPEKDQGFPPAEAIQQAARCLHCDCRALSSCKLRRYAALYGADPGRYKGGRKVLRIYTQHSRVLYEPGKCIDCGLCIEIAAAAGEPLGLSFVGRGFDVRIGVPFNRPLEEALGKVAAQCVAACPTAALSLKDEQSALSLKEEEL